MFTMDAKSNFSIYDNQSLEPAIKPLTEFRANVATTEKDTALPHVSQWDASDDLMPSH